MSDLGWGGVTWMKKMVWEVRDCTDVDRSDADLIGAYVGRKAHAHHNLVWKNDTRGYFALFIYTDSTMQAYLKVWIRNGFIWLGGPGVGDKFSLSDPDSMSKVRCEVEIFLGVMAGMGDTDE